MTPLRLREVLAEDLPIFFEHQRDPDANRMANFPARERNAFMAHWLHKVMKDENAIVRTILFDEEVAGNVVSWLQDGQRLVGYWIGRAFWNKGIASRALAEYLRQVTARPLHARVAMHNIGSIRVLEKCGFALSGSEQHEGIEELIYALS